MDHALHLLQGYVLMEHMEDSLSRRVPLSLFLLDISMQMEMHTMRAHRVHVVVQEHDGRVQILVQDETVMMGMRR